MDLASLAAIATILATTGAGGMWVYRVYFSARRRTAAAPVPSTDAPPPTRKDVARSASLVVAAAVVARRGQVLMVKRRPKGEKLSWQFPSGGVRPGEVPAAEVVKEVFKETNIRCEVDTELSKRTHPDTGAYVHYFACRYLEGEAKNLDRDENDDVAWVNAGDVKSMISTDLDAKVADYLETIAS